MAINKKSVGQKIKLIRQTKGMTLEEFGKLFQASKGNVSLWEKGSSLPSNERIKQIAQIGNMSIDELLSHTQIHQEDIFNEVKQINQKLEALTKEIEILNQKLSISADQQIVE